jgi:Zn-dependent M32 family carboxypeptidase
MRLLFAILMLAVAATPSIAKEAHKGAVDAIMRDYEAAALGNIKSFCAEKWPTDFAMQSYCVKKAKKAYARSQAFDVMASNENSIIWSTCSQRWSDAQDRVDWSMMAYCLDKQTSALKSLK